MGILADLLPCLLCAYGYVRLHQSEEKTAIGRLRNVQPFILELYRIWRETIQRALQTGAQQPDEACLCSIAIAPHLHVLSFLRFRTLNIHCYPLDTLAFKISKHRG